MESTKSNSLISVFSRFVGCNIIIEKSILFPCIRSNQKLNLKMKLKLELKMQIPWDKSNKRCARSENYKILLREILKD